MVIRTHKNTGKHEGAEGQYLGDLPVLVVNNDGIAIETGYCATSEVSDEVKR